MTNTEGLAAAFVLIVGFLIVFGAIELLVIYTILKRTTNRIFHIGIPVLVLLLGYFLTMQADASSILFASFFLIGPMATLIPPFAISDLTDPESRFTRMLISYIAVSIFGIAPIFLFSLSGLLMSPEFWYHTPLSNAKIYAGIIILDVLVAFLIYGIIHAYRNLRMKDEKPA